MSFAEHLMTLRKQRGWSQEELGSQINVTRQTVSKWEMGQSTPELEKLVEFHISIDQLVGLEETEETGFSSAPHNRGDMRSVGVYYEYISPVKVFGLPLVHVRLGFGPRLAKGIVAIGNFAVGGLSLGLLSLGGLAVGGFAVGGCAVGQWLAMGGGAFSNYLAIGGGAWSNGLAIGGSAYGHVAVGTQEASGWFSLLPGSGYTVEEAWGLVKAQFPHIWGWVRNVIQWAIG